VIVLLLFPPCLSSQGYIPRGIDQSYIPGFLAREIERAAANAGSSGSSSGGRGALLLSKVVAKYGALMGVDHLALVLHRLAQMTQHGTAGSDEVRGSAGAAAGGGGGGGAGGGGVRRDARRFEAVQQLLAV
jgi:hypothetical protein